MVQLSHVWVSFFGNLDSTSDIFVMDLELNCFPHLFFDFARPFFFQKLHSGNVGVSDYPFVCLSICAFFHDLVSAICSMCVVHPMWCEL